jgi:UDP-N-acetyl-D-mannosaminuronate dehydrogenase
MVVRTEGDDVDPAKVATLQRGEAPFYEPGLEPLLRKHVEAGRLRFTTDLTYVDDAIARLAAHLNGPALVVGKSTVPVGTAERLQATLHELAGPDEDTLRPDRLVFGVRGPRAESVLRQVYAEAIGNDTPVVVTDYATAELVKTSANAFLATKITFITPSPRSATRPAPTSPRWPTRSGTTPASDGGSSTQASVMAGGACPRMCGPSVPGPRSSGSDTHSTSSRGWRRSMPVVATGLSS